MGMGNRSLPRPMGMVGIPRMQAPGMGPYNLASQAAMGGMNAAGLPMQRGVQQQPQVWFSNIPLLFHQFNLFSSSKQLIVAIIFMLNSREEKIKEWGCPDILSRNQDGFKVIFLLLKTELQKYFLL